MAAIKKVEIIKSKHDSWEDENIHTSLNEYKIRIVMLRMKIARILY